MLYREIITVRSKIHTQHINAVSRTWDLWMLSMVVYKVTIVGLWEGKHTQTEIITESQEYSFFLPVSQQPYWGLGRLIGKVPRFHTDTPHSEGLLWTSDRPAPDTSSWQHITLTRDRHTCPQRDSNLQSQQADGRRPKPQAARPPASANAVLIQNVVTLIYFVLMFASSCPLRLYMKGLH